MAGFASRGREWTIISDVAEAATLVWSADSGYTLLISVLTVVQGILPAIQLWISKILIDTVSVVIQGGESGVQEYLTSLLALISAQGGLLILSTFLATAQETVRPLLGELLSNKTNLKILNKSNNLEIAFFENERFYDNLQNAYKEAYFRPLDIVCQLFNLIQSIIVLISIAVLLMRLHWTVILLILITALPVLIVQNRYGFRNYWMLRERAPELRKQQYYSMLLTSNWFIKEIRTLQLEGYFVDLCRSLFGKFFEENRNLLIKRNTSNMLASTGSNLGWIIAAGYLVLRVLARTITIGDFLLYTQAILAAQGQFQALYVGLSGVYSNSLFIHNLFEFLSQPARKLSEGRKWKEPIQEIEFHDVSFSYPGSDSKVLNKVNFKIQRGQSLALVGKNGTGKTTLIKLLCCLYKPSSGEIYINGKNISDYSPSSVQDQMVVLFQDYGHYYLTAQENIGFGRITKLNEWSLIEKAAKRSGADRLIETLPDKYETMLGKWFEKGVELSGGEWQKVALARAFFRNGSVFILDEPTTSLDAEAEHEVFNDLTKYCANRITLLISHRFSTVRMADKILVLEKGRCIESGSHEELMFKGGYYANLFRLQASGYDYGRFNNRTFQDRLDPLDTIRRGFTNNRNLETGMLDKKSERLYESSKYFG
jgi:ATP-binding cassette, subfamily B, bacterial